MVWNAFTKDSDYIEAILAGRFDPQIILWGYSKGIFPMGQPGKDAVEWYSPDPRGIIDLEDFHVPRTLRSIVRNGRFRVTINAAFGQVVDKCADREETWISRQIIDCYTHLHEMGFAHSVESWIDDELAGGLYGVAMGGAFFGESMFHTRTHGSKVALVGLVHQLRRQDFLLLDIQYLTEHLLQFGAWAIPRIEYINRLEASLQKKRLFFAPDQSTIDLAQCV